MAKHIHIHNKFVLICLLLILMLCYRSVDSKNIDQELYSDYIKNRVYTDDSQRTNNELSIREAWQEILKKNQGLKAQYLSTKSSEKLRMAAKLSYLPQIDLNAFYVHLGNKVQIDLVHDRAEYDRIYSGISGSTLPNKEHILSLMRLYGTPVTLLEQDVVVGALNILYPLYAGGARYYGNKLAEVALKDSYQALRLKELATFEEIVEIYYAFVLSEEVLLTLQYTEESALKHYQNAQKLHKLGQIADIELLGAQVAYDKAKNKTLAARNAQELAQLALDSALQIQDTKTTSPLKVDLDMKLQSQDYYVLQTLKSYPALNIAKNKITASEYTKKLEFGSFMPQVGAFGSFIVTDNRSKLEQMAPSWYVGIGAKWSIVSPQGRLQKYQIAKISQLQASALEIQAIRDMELLVKKTYKQVILYKEEYEALNSSVALAKENLKLQEKAFSQGIATNDSVVDARNTLNVVVTEQKSVAYKIIIAFAKLQALSGNLETFFEYQK